MRTIDYPRLRAHPVCPSCGQPKPHSALLCWLCFNFHSTLDGGIDCVTDMRIRRAEANLTTAANFTCDYPAIAQAERGQVVPAEEAFDRLAKRFGFSGE